MMVELWTRKREMVDEDENDMGDTSGYEKSGVRLRDWVQKTSYLCHYPPDPEQFLLYRGWSIDSYTKFSQVPFSHDDFPHLF
jgi:hypothetical protein